MLNACCCPSQGRFRVVIKCCLSVAPENMAFYSGQPWEVMPLPEYITKIGPYVIEQEEADNQIITTYEFDKSKFVEAWECISEQLDAFRIIPGFTLSVLILDKGREVIKGYQISLNQGSGNRGVSPSSKSLSLPHGCQGMT